MRPIFFKAFGYVTLFVILPILMGPIPDDPYNAPSFPHQFRTLVAWGSVTVIGVGLLYLRKWAAIYFSVPLFCYGAGFAITSIELIPFPLNLAHIALGASLMLPLFVTIRVWSQLTWGGGWLSKLDDAPRIIRALRNPRHTQATSHCANSAPLRGHRASMSRGVLDATGSRRMLRDDPPRYRSGY